MFKTVVLAMVFMASAAFGMSLSKLNTASKDELMQIKGIGAKKADAIIKERRKGKFKSFEDLQRVDGIGEQIASNVKNDVKVGETPKKVKKTASKKSHKKSTAKKSVKKKESASKKKAEKKSHKAKKTTDKKEQSKSKKEKAKKAEKELKKKKAKNKKTKSKKSKKSKKDKKAA